MYNFNNKKIILSPNNVAAFLSITIFLFLVNYISLGFVSLWLFGSIHVILENNLYHCPDTFECLFQRSITAGFILFAIFTPLFYYIFWKTLFNKESNFYLKKKGWIIILSLIIFWAISDHFAMDLEVYFWQRNLNF
jgi:hypothetical protein